MQEVFLCCTAADRLHTEPLIKALEAIDALRISVEGCEPGQLPEACEAASDADGVILLLSSNAVPASATREVWRPVLERLERAPHSIACVRLEVCTVPRLLTERALTLTPDTAPRELQRWAIALDTTAERFEIASNPDDADQQRICDEQFGYRDVIWIPCANRAHAAINADLTRAVDARRTMIVLDRRPPELELPPTTRENLVQIPTSTPAPTRIAEMPPAVATCYTDYLHRDFCAEIANMDPSRLADLIPPLSADRRILRVPHGALRHLNYAAEAPRRRHADVLHEILSGRNADEYEQLIRLELPAALDFTFRTDWNFAARLIWRACQVLRDRWPAESADYLLRLWNSATEHGVNSWVQLTERELGWYGITPAKRQTKRKPAAQQLKLDW